MINERSFLKIPTSFKGKCKLYPFSVNDMLEEENFVLYKRILTYSQEELEDEFVKEAKDNSEFRVPTPLEFILINSYNNKEFEELSKNAFKFFIKEDVTFIYDKKAILIGDLEEKIKEIKSFDELIFIEEDEFFDFQNMIREFCCGEKPVEKPNPNEDPRVKRIKAKARYRDKIKAKKGMGISLGTILASICCMGIGITPLNIGNVSYAAIKGIMDTYQAKESYHNDVDIILAGGDAKKIKPKYWIRNLE